MRRIVLPPDTVTLTLCLLISDHDPSSRTCSPTQMRHIAFIKDPDSYWVEVISLNK